MKNTYHPASERGHVDFGWLDSHHSFSFGNWHDREKVHFGALRVLNDDVVKNRSGATIYNAIVNGVPTATSNNPGLVEAREFEALTSTDQQQRNQTKLSLL